MIQKVTIHFESPSQKGTMTIKCKEVKVTIDERHLSREQSFAWLVNNLTSHLENYNKVTVEDTPDYQKTYD